ncbi:FtsX-like permease family protein [candidate division WWE3 bacterium]|nr:FtsX-like permease family protein [candidate division WWE3 bacterium]
MNIPEAFRSALRSLFSNKIRTFLTMLGVIIGVFAVVALVSLVEGIENYIVDRFNAIGSNLIIVAPGNAGFAQDPAISFTKKTLEEKHVDLLRKELGGLVPGVTPSIRLIKKASYRAETHPAIITAANWEAADLFSVDIVEGRFYTKAEVINKDYVVLLAPAVKEDLFGDADALGKKVKIGSKQFTVIGLTGNESGQSNERAFMPYTTAQEVFDVDSITNILTKAKSPDTIDQVATEIEHILVQELDPNDFTVISQSDILASIGDILDVLSIVLVAIAGISLVVGGIGIMNIMLVTVNERIREIGLRKALGATRIDIAGQFFIESVLISLIGGLFGLLVSWFLTLGIRSVLRAEITPWAIALSLGFSFLVGAVFGTYPAVKAAKKDPIEALRHE